MPKPSAHLLCWSEERQLYELSVDGQLEQRFEVDGGLLWLDFLEAHASFAFQGQQGHLSVIKETRPRGTGYWYAYRSHGQQTRKRYLGQARKMTIAHLEEVAGILAQVSPNVATTQLRRQPLAPSSPHSALLLPKLLPPRLPSSLVARPRLLARLDAGLERKLILLVAPAGFGKTTVVRQWLANLWTSGWAGLVAWVSLDSGDNNLFRFWHSVITACQTTRQNVGQAALASLSEASQPPFASPQLETALTLLLNDLMRWEQGGLLILDDYHALEDLRIHETLTFFIDHLPPTFCVLLMTRAEPPSLPLLRWRARADLSELYGTDLRFSLEETSTFLRRAFPDSLSDEVIEQLDTSLQGWIAGLRLLSLTRTGQLMSHAVERALAFVDQSSDPASPYQPLLDYFVTEILNAQPEPLQHFLLQTSVLSRLSGPLCAAVTGVEHSAELLETIELSGLLLEALDGAWYRYHALFAEALRCEALRRLGEASLRALSSRASHWYRQHSMPSEAIEAALQATDFEVAALLIEQMGADGPGFDLSIVHNWISRMPEEALSTHPLLCWLAALALQMLQEDAHISTATRTRVVELLSLAEEGWRAQGQLSFLGLIPAFHAISAWRSDTFPQALASAQLALAQLSRDEQDDRIQVFRGSCLFIVGIGFMYDGRFGEAQSTFLEAHACSLISGDRHFTRGVLVLVGVCSYTLGELHRAHEHYQQALSEARTQEDREIIAQALLCLANIAFDWNELALAEQQTNEALTFALEEEVDLHHGAALQLALLAYARGQTTLAQQQLAVLQARLQVTSTPRANLMLHDVLIWQARLFLETADFQNLARILEPLDLEENLTARIFQARLLLAQDQPQEAALQLERLLPVAQDARELHHVLEIQIVLALAHAACQQGSQAQLWLRQALSQARVEGVLRLFLAEGQPLAALLRQVLPTLREPTLRSFAQTLLRAFALSNQENYSSSNDLLVESLSEQEQRVLRLLIAGRSNPEIAQALFVSVNTVKSHVKHLYRKLGVSNRLQASSAARQLNLL